MKKEHLFKSQFNSFPGSQNNKTTVKRRKYPVSSKTEYNSISEAVEEYKSNYGIQFNKRGSGGIQKQL